MALVRYFRECCWTSSRAKPEKNRQEQYVYSVHQDTSKIQKSKIFCTLLQNPKTFGSQNQAHDRLQVYVSWFHCSIINWDVGADLPYKWRQVLRQLKLSLVSVLHVQLLPNEGFCNLLSKDGFPVMEQLMPALSSDVNAELGEKR